MEALMIEILASLCQTGAKLYGMAMGLIGVGILVQILLLMWFTKARKSPGTVSYTHLDVYKRQGVGVGEGTELLSLDQKLSEGVGAACFSSSSNSFNTSLTMSFK